MDCFFLKQQKMMWHNLWFLYLKNHFKVIRLQPWSTTTSCICQNVYTTSSSDFRTDHKKYNLLWQTGSQSKQVPPTFKATNSCPPTTLPKTSKQSCSWAQESPTSHTATEQPAGLFCRCLKANKLSTRHPCRTQVKAIPGEKRGRERGKGQGQQDPQRSPFA